ncbi:MAG: class I SAM-dependent methyltransferase [Bacteroidota bacterium]
MKQEKTICPFCKSANNKSSGYENTFYNNKIFSYLKCTNCNLIFLNPLPNHDDYAAMYPPSYQGEISETAEYERDFNKVIDIIEKYGIGKKILDFGCGNGAFLAQAAKKGYDCFGVEFDENLIENLNTKIKSCRFQSVKNFENNTDKFDVIHMSNVLEHFTNPAEVMAQLKEHLSENGIFIIYGPIENNLNLALLVRKLVFFSRKLILNRNNTHAPTHIFHSNAKNQKEFFKNLNLKQHYFVVDEQCWPFPDSMKEANSFSKKIMFFIAKFSQFVSSVFPGMGNIFLYVGSKNK